jgi:hypothetical protein
MIVITLYPIPLPIRGKENSHNSLSHGPKPHPTANKRIAEKDLDHSFNFSLTNGAQRSIFIRLSHEDTLDRTGSFPMPQSLLQFILEPRIKGFQLVSELGTLCLRFIS